MIIKPGTLVVAPGASDPTPLVEFPSHHGCADGTTDYGFSQSSGSMGMTTGSGTSSVQASSLQTVNFVPESRSVSTRALETAPPPGWHPAAGARIHVAASRVLPQVPPPSYLSVEKHDQTDLAAGGSATSHIPPVPQGTRLRDPNDNGAKQLIVKFLAPQVTEAELRALFQQFGPVEYSRMIYDSISGASKGYGFVYYYRSADAAEAVAGMDKFELYGRYLRVGFAIPQRQPPAPPPLPGQQPVDGPQ